MSSRRNKSKGRRRSPPGAPPGTITVDPCAPMPVTTVFSYGGESFTECQIAKPTDIEKFLHNSPVTWVNVEGLGSADTIKEMGRIFKLHPLTLEDVVNTHQRAKVEEYPEYLFLVSRMVRLEARLETEQVSFFLGKDFVLTFLEDPRDSFNTVRERLRKNHGRLRTSGPSYLAYALLDAVLDDYFPVIEKYGDRLDVLEDQVILQPDPNAIRHVHDIKRDLRTLRRSIWSQREVFHQLGRDTSSLIDAESRVYFRDCHDHTVQIIDLVETYRELGSDLTDLYLSSLSNRMNEVMKVLTMIATIFMPLSFLASLYGMNFDPNSSPWNMPELRSYYGYPFALGLMGAIALLMTLFFWKKKWIGTPSATQQIATGANTNQNF